MIFEEKDDEPLAESEVINIRTAGEIEEERVSKKRKSITRTFSVSKEFNESLDKELEFRQCELSELIRYALMQIMEHDKPPMRRRR